MVNEKILLISSKMTLDPRLDPKTYGQKWIDIHSLAASVEAKEDAKNILKAIRVILESIRCQKCYQHAMEYLEQNPPEQTIDLQDENGRYIGVFKYFHEFHNVVNLKLGKPYMNYETARDMYYTKIETCDNFCGV